MLASATGKPHMDIFDEAIKNEELTIELRRYFHENPELSWSEENTVKYICNMLGSLKIEYFNIKGGVLGIIRGGQPGKTVVLRADMDALAIQENPMNLSKKRTCVSKVEGVMHACGHDGHTAILLTVARILKEHSNELKGTIVLMFERGEESTIKGWITFVDKMKELGIKPDAVCATHLFAELESGKINICDGDCMTSVTTFYVTIIGKGGHGSAPEKAISPIDCYPYVYTEFAERCKSIPRLRYSVCTVHAGTQRNIIPDTLEFCGTARTFDMNVPEMFIATLKETLEKVCVEHRCEYKLECTEPGHPIINDRNIASDTRKAIAEILGKDSVFAGEPWTASDSWGGMTSTFPGIMILVGTANEKKGSGALHHCDRFDLDEESLKNGVVSMLAFVDAET